MQIVIDLPEETYRDVVKNGFIYDEDNEVLSYAIIKGTPLPKHGRLKDVDWILHLMDTTDLQPKTQNEYDAWNFAKSLFELSPTIIEPYEGESENKDADSN